MTILFVLIGSTKIAIAQPYWKPKTESYYFFKSLNINVELNLISFICIQNGISSFLDVNLLLKNT